MIKRILICLLTSFIFGLFIALSMFSENDYLLTKLFIIGIHMQTGFVIGISRLKLNWWLHGIVIGGIMAIPRCIDVSNPMIRNNEKIILIVYTIVFGMLCGLFVEFFTTKIFKVKKEI